MQREERYENDQERVERALKKYIPDGTQAKGQVCPKCGDTLVFEEGCLICKKCGYSKCGS